MRKYLLAIGTLLFCALPALAQKTTYTYTGDEIPACKCRITGSITTSAPIPASTTELVLAVEDFHFEADGVVIDKSNYDPSDSIFENFSTDSSGNITYWEFQLAKAVKGSDQYEFFSINLPQYNNVRDFVVILNDEYVVYHPGVWMKRGGLERVNK